MVLEELNIRIQNRANEIRNTEDVESVKESAELIVKFSQLQNSITSLLDIALDTVLEQKLTLTCNG